MDLIHHQAVICGVAFLPEAGRRSLLLAGYVIRWLKAYGTRLKVFLVFILPCAARPVPCADTAPCI
jgi:hypothetical protein